MNQAKFTEKIAFRSHDNEGDVWCEHAFLFEDDHFVRAFFYETNPLLIEIFADGGDGKLHNFKVYDENPAKLINTVSFWTDDAHEVVIKRMADGHVLDITPFSTARNWPGGTTVPIRKEPVDDKYITIKVEEGDFVLKSYDVPVVVTTLEAYIDVVKGQIEESGLSVNDVTNGKAVIVGLQKIIDKFKV